METVLTELLMVATFIAFFVSALLEVFKKAFDKFPTKFVPVIALALGVFIGLLAHISFDLGMPFAYMLWGGGIAGLASVGFFEGAIKPLKSSK